jgi:LAO/AO transport system kinase
MDNLADRILSGDLRALARAATRVENRDPKSEALLKRLFPHTGRALLVGITGSPGAGKSTLTDQLTKLLRAENKRVGIIAVDPTSPFSGGAILGDRVRMMDHHGDPGVFIRSMATRGSLGGLAAATHDLTLLIDAAGFDVIFVETVGVGQDEVEIARLADVTVVVLVPGMGDDVQAIKAGILEIADVFVLNKSDQLGTDRLEREMAAALTFDHRADGWTPPLVRTSASEGQGISETLAAIRRFRDFAPHARRTPEAWAARLREIVRDRLATLIPQDKLDSAAELIARRELDPYTAADDILSYSCSFIPSQERTN